VRVGTGDVLAVAAVMGRRTAYALAWLFPGQSDHQVFFGTAIAFGVLSPLGLLHTKDGLVSGWGSFLHHGLDRGIVAAASPTVPAVRRRLQFRHHR